MTSPKNYMSNSTTAYYPTLSSNVGTSGGWLGNMQHIYSSASISYQKPYFIVSTTTHDIEKNTCKNCNHIFLVNSKIIYTYEESMQHLSCNEVIMQDVIE